MMVNSEHLLCARHSDRCFTWVIILLIVIKQSYFEITIIIPISPIRKGRHKEVNLPA